MKKGAHHELRLSSELVSPVSGTEKKLVAEVVELCGTAGVGVLIRKNHKIQPEELELCEESEMMSSIVAYASVPNECRVRVLIVVHEEFLPSGSELGNT